MDYVIKKELENRLNDLYRLLEDYFTCFPQRETTTKLTSIIGKITEIETLIKK